MTTLLTQISWSNHLAILSKAKTEEERHFYMQAYKNYGYKPTDREFKFIKDNQTTTFRKRNLIDVDSVPISFENFILNLDGNI